MEYSNFTFDKLTINTKSLRKEYQERKAETKRSVHWSQRKLLLSEIEFFTIYLNDKIKSPICIYVGAAPGDHILPLSRMFPNLVFHLYDSSNFNINETDKIKIYNTYFTDEIAAQYKDRNNIFFISDIRTSDFDALYKDFLLKLGIKDPTNAPRDLVKSAQKSSEIEHGKEVWSDMEMQQKWVLIMNPIHCLLKFQLPWPLLDKNHIPIDRKIKYLKGIIFWQQWAPQNTTETRLKPVKGNDGKYEISEWSILEYEQLCAYQNTEIRENTQYKNLFTNNEDPIDYPELLNDYDSIAEVEILRMYFKSFNNNEIKNILNLSKLITSELNKSQGKSASLSDHRNNTRHHDQFSKNKISDKVINIEFTKKSVIPQSNIIPKSIIPKSIIPQSNMEFTKKSVISESTTTPSSTTKPLFPESAVPVKPSFPRSIIPTKTLIPESNKETPIKRSLIPESNKYPESINRPLIPESTKDPESINRPLLSETPTPTRRTIIPREKESTESIKKELIPKATFPRSLIPTTNKEI